MAFSNRLMGGLIVGTLVVLIAAACGSSGNGHRATPSATTSAPVIDPAQFTNQITNRYFPLTPGTTYFFDETVDGAAHKVEVTVTHDTKTILGVTCVVVHDVVKNPDGTLVEDTYDWYAQDSAGNVWYFGEDTKEYENGAVISTKGTWEAGVDGAEPGIIMEATPKAGDSYRQEYYVSEAEDMAKVTELNGSIDMPNGSYQQVLITEETTALEPGQVDQKYYAPGVGFVYSTQIQGGSAETRLTRITTE